MNIAKAMKKIHKEISQVVNGQEDHLGKATFMQRKYLEMVSLNWPRYPCTASDDIWDGILTIPFLCLSF